MHEQFDLNEADEEFLELLKSGFWCTGSEIDDMERRGYDAQDQARRKWYRIMDNYGPIARGLRNKEDLPDDRHRIRREP